MTWFLIFILEVRPLSYEKIGSFPDYTTCHAEAVWQTKESSYIDKWACVQLPTTIKD